MLEGHGYIAWAYSCYLLLSEDNFMTETRTIKSNLMTPYGMRSYPNQKPQSLMQATDVPLHLKYLLTIDEASHYFIRGPP